ncbi:MAG TPA: hypothetical protein VN749_05855, partial [Candidatus Eisenbacteria bacterium]|nr:hypothetical protein [Candidatus Eisenbacteria bacterium]
LAPLEELLAELGAENKSPVTRSVAGQRASVPASPAWAPKSEIANAASANSVPSFGSKTPMATPLANPSFSAPTWRSEQSSTSAACATAIAPTPNAIAAKAASVEEMEEREEAVADSKSAMPQASAVQKIEIAEAAANGNTSEVVETAALPANGATKGSAAKGITEEQILDIRGAIQTQQKFLGELLEHGHRWELEGTELRIFFATDKRPFAEMVEGRDALEKIRAAASKALHRPVRVCAKIESVAATATPASRVPPDSQELRAKFERDPMVRSMLQRFGGKISEVRRREEGL